MRITKGDIVVFEGVTYIVEGFLPGGYVILTCNGLSADIGLTRDLKRAIKAGGVTHKQKPNIHDLLNGYYNPPFYRRIFTKILRAIFPERSRGETQD